MQTWIWFNWWTKRQLQILALSVFIFQRSLQWSEFSLGFETSGSITCEAPAAFAKASLIFCPICGFAAEVLVLVDFESNMSDELTVRLGDVVKNVTVASEEGWLHGELRGKKGIFPSNFVKVCRVFTSHRDLLSVYVIFIKMLFSLLFPLLAASTSVFNGWRLEGAPEPQKKYNAKLKFSLVSFFLVNTSCRKRAVNTQLKLVKNIYIKPIFNSNSRMKRQRSLPQNASFGKRSLFNISYFQWSSRSL